MIKKLPKGLNAQMLYTVFIAVVCALVIFLCASMVGKSLVSNVYMSTARVNERKNVIASEFAAYVSARHIRGTDQAAIARWTEGKSFVTIYLYKNRHLNFRAGEGIAENVASFNSEELQQYKAQFGTLYSVEFADGTYQIAISETSQMREIAIVNIISVFIASVAFLLVLLEYVSRLKNRIILLSKQARIVGSGDLDAPIYARGDDELTALAEEMNSMRNSVLERTAKEARAWQANTELITAVSHDIRTPMTALIGYLDLFNKAGDEQTRKAFSDAAYRKAIELKELTDELFKYFLVFGGAEIEMSPERYDADILLTQLVNETAFYLGDMGFEVETVFDELDAEIFVEPTYLKRVFTNMESNIRKYADAASPVVLSVKSYGDQLVITVKNRIRESIEHVESTKIGVRTCIKIMEQMNGSFETAANGEYFTAAVTLPSYTTEKETEKA